jgi:phosphate/sulfate permease
LEIGRKQSQCTHLYFSAFGCDKQSIDWAIYAVGITKGVKTVIEQNLTEIFIGWFLIPIVTGLIAAALYIAVHMKYIPEF